MSAHAAAQTESFFENQDQTAIPQPVLKLVQGGLTPFDDLVDFGESIMMVAGENLRCL